MEREICETYHFIPSDYDEKGHRRKDGHSFRELVCDFERDFHSRHSTEYALNFYANSNTMLLLQKSCNAEPFMMYGMDLTQGKSFDAEQDPYINHEMDKHSKHIYVYGIDSAYMTEFDEYGYPIFGENSDIYPFTLLIDKTMKDGEVRLAVPTLDDGDDTVKVPVGVPQFEYA